MAVARIVTVAVIVALCAGACKGHDKPSTPPPHRAGSKDARPSAARPAKTAAKPANTKQAACHKLPFANQLPIAEASGAVVVPAGHNRPAHLLVVADSGNRGEFNEVAMTDGRVLRSGHLPLDSRVSDDLEGLTRIGDTYYAITSSGWVQQWRLNRHGNYELVRPAYPIANPRHHPHMICTATKVNCGRNYEALCALPDATSKPRGSCIGFVGSKRLGRLYCLTLKRDGRLRAHTKRKLDVASRAQLAGCHFADGVLYAGMNLFGANRVLRIRGWANPATATIERMPSLGRGFSEALAVAPGGIIYRMSDMGGAPSLVDKYKCE